MANFGAQHLRRPPRSTVQHHQRRFTGTLEPSPPTTPNVAPSTQLITSILIPDLISLITRCSQDPISGGTYGNIYKCIYDGPEGNEEVAVKVIRPQFFSPETFRRELGIWKRLRHSNILKFMGTTSDFGGCSNNEALGLRDRLLSLRDIAAGFNYLHTFSLTEDGRTDLNPVVHGDLTGTNVLIDGNRKAYLADFGLSGTFKKLTGMTYLAKMTCHPGAVRWAAPELLSGEESDSAATTQSDMYSFGSIILQVLTGNVPWCHLTREFQISYQVVIEGKMHSRPDDVCVTDPHWDFMTRCWSMSLTDRPPAKEAVRFVDSALHPNTSPQSLTTSPQTPTLSISSDERHPGITRNDYLRRDTDARLPVMDDYDSPLDAREKPLDAREKLLGAREKYSGVMLPAYPSTIYTTSLEPSCKTPYRY
ncbi:kinase-like domain-containing protein [Suillus subalutaceus]|uniref:kinase-like domain-containing protein n=1 Tax=Suillus subalutaceus TaxID=48586 RepID=UPI001B864E6A|nr:kinase-like domain-containing protein [Suillus subalutaceus]KAG1841654.1 kinase-like domain-containing protein [Suillus subalutaceus]